MVCVTLEGLWIVSNRIVDFGFFVNFHRSGHAIISSFWTPTQHVSYASKKIVKDLINMVSVTLEGLWMVSVRIVDFRIIVKFHRSGPTIIFSFWSLTEHVSYASKKIVIKQKTSWTWWVLLWKDYGWFLLELSIFELSSNFTSPEL